MASKLKFSVAMRTMVKQRYLYLMLLPALVFIIVFNYLPVTGWVMAFTKYSPGQNMWQAPWVGLKHFIDFFTQSSDAAIIIRNTLVMNIGTMIVSLAAAFLFAILLNEIRWKTFSKVAQSITFFPYFMSWVILYALIYALFSASSGAVNETLVSAGILSEGINILGDKQYSWPLIIFVNTWHSLGYDSVIFIAAIAGVPKEELEAASIDGANRFGRIRHITVPNMLPTLTVLLIMYSGWLLNSGLDQYFVFLNPTNKETMDVFDMYVYRYGMKLLNYSYATAVGIIKALISFLLILTVNQISKKVSGRSLF